MGYVLSKKGKIIIGNLIYNKKLSGIVSNAILKMIEFLLIEYSTNIIRFKKIK